MISIIVPVYNVEKYVSGCIQSLISQTYQEIEIILVDDGSVDSSGKLCDEFSLRDNRIKVIHKENGGLSSARNTGLKKATGQYIMFVDGDDYLAENAVELLVRLNEQYCADIVQFDYCETTQDYHQQHVDIIDDGYYTEDQKEMFNRLYQIGGPAASACTKLYSVSLFDDLQFKEGIIHEDEYIVTYMLQKAKSVLYTSARLYFYVMREGSIVKSCFSKKKLDKLFVSEDRIGELKRLGYDDLIQKENNRYFMTLSSLWCEAKKAKDDEALQVITRKLKRFLKNETVLLAGKFRLLFSFCKKSLFFLYVYYFYKKLTKQV